MRASISEGDAVDQEGNINNGQKKKAKGDDASDEKGDDEEDEELSRVDVVLTAMAIRDCREMLFRFEKNGFVMSTVEKELGERVEILAIDRYHYGLELVNILLDILQELTYRIRHKKTTVAVGEIVKSLLITIISSFQSQLTTGDLVPRMSELAFEFICHGVKYGVKEDRSQMLQFGASVYQKLFSVLTTRARIEERKGTRKKENLDHADAEANKAAAEKEATDGIPGRVLERFKDLYTLHYEFEGIDRLLQLILEMSSCWQNSDKRFEFEKAFIEEFPDFDWY